MQLIIIVVAFIIFFLIVNGKQSNEPLLVFLNQKSYVFHRINKLLKKNVSPVLDALFKPFDEKCTVIIKSLPKNYNLNEIELLKTENVAEFEKLHRCGYIHNLCMIVALSLWTEYAKFKTEVSLTTFITKYLQPILESPHFQNGDMVYTDIETGILELLELLI